MKLKRIAFVVIMAMALSPAFAQEGVFTNGFERDDPFELWHDFNIVSDTTALSGTHVCRVVATREFGLGVTLLTSREFAHKNLKLTYKAFYRFMNDTPDCSVVVSVNEKAKNGYWSSHPIVGNVGQWFDSGFSTSIPADYITDSAVIKIYVWNNNGQAFDIDDAMLEIKADPIPRFLPEPLAVEPAGKGHKVVGNGYFGVSYNSLNKAIALYDSEQSLTNGFYTVTEAVLESDTITFYGMQWLSDGNGSYRCETPIGSTKISFADKGRGRLAVSCENSYHFDMRIARQSLVVPFVDDVTEIYRNNCATDTSSFQDCYYLSDRGFSVGEGRRRVSVYHNDGISSLQLDAANRTAYFNADFWRDHPLMHFPLNNDTLDYSIDISCREVDATTVIRSEFELFVGIDASRLPVFMPTRDGYDAAVIFTEHADWTDIRTQRAVLFGNENITEADSAVGGFVYYDIPVTKSVFYNNPDHITNKERSGGVFTSEQATLMGNAEFLVTISQLHKRGFDICLHTPEQYTAHGKNMEKALSFMHENFNSVSWIDHGYNNTVNHNREDLVCDGLLPKSQWYSLPLWRKYGIRYLWNAYYEEHAMRQYDFDCNLKQPYPGFGDALPCPQITTLPDGDTTVLLWSTPSTFETNSDMGWDYLYSRERLERLADNHDVHITHIYPAWVLQERSFWEYDANGLATARKGFNDALARLSDLREQRRLNVVTIADYLSYYEALRKIKYLIADRNHITITNNGDAVKGVTMLFGEMPDFGGKKTEFRQAEDGFVVWFDMDENESVTIKYRK